MLRQRRALLKSAGAARPRLARRPDLRTLDVWDAKLAQIGAQIIVARRALVAALAPARRATRTSRSARGRATRDRRTASLEAGRSTPSLETRATSRRRAVELVEAQLLEAMGRLRSKEIERGVCLVGPHRDDLVLTLGGLPAKGYASHGESWSFALALRLASYELLTHGGDGDDAGSAATGAPTASRCSSSTTCSPSSTRAAATGWPSSSRRRAAGAHHRGGGRATCPEPLAGARVDVMGGEVTRVL